MIKLTKPTFLLYFLLISSFSSIGFSEALTIHLKQKNNRFMNCNGQGKNQGKVMIGITHNEIPQSLKLNGRNYKITRVDPSSNGKGFVMMARSGQKFIRFISTKREVDRLKTRIYVGFRSESRNKDLVTGSFPLVCNMNPT